MALIGLIDVDSHHYPNLALMKISAYHKSKGDEVEWWWGWGQYDKVYDKPHAPKEIRRLQRWCNNKRIFNTTERFEDYDPKRG